MPNNTIGFKLKKAREEKNLSISHVANSLNCNEEVVLKWEKDKELPSIDFLIPLSKILTVDLEEILSTKKENETFNASILVSSIKYSNNLIANSLPRDIEEKINQYLIPITKQSLKENGVPISTGSEYFMAYFSGNNHEKRAMTCAEEIYKTFKSECTTTINTGSVYLANLGYKEYAHTTIIGKGVNDALLLNNWFSHNSESHLICTEKIYTKTQSKLNFSPSHDHILNNNITVYIHS